MLVFHPVLWVEIRENGEKLQLLFREKYTK